MTDDPPPVRPAPGSAGAPTIRPEQPGDEDEIASVVAAAFGSPSEAELVAAIRSSPGFVPELSLVAVLDGHIAGHVMISRASLRDGDAVRPILTLSPLAVSPEVQGCGIGAALVRDVTARAADRDEPVVVLEGDPAYYGRFGFEPATPQGVDITLPSWAPPEAAQLLRLPAYHGAIRGSVVYPPAFDGVLEH